MKGLRYRVQGLGWNLGLGFIGLRSWGSESNWGYYSNNGEIKLQKNMENEMDTEGNVASLGSRGT